MKLGEVFRFEVEYRVRSTSTWVYAAILLGVPFLMLHAVNGSGGHLNAPSGVATLSTLVSMFGMLVSAALFGDAATRDAQTGMHPLFYTAPLREVEYLGGRFLGALVVNAVLLLGVPLGQWICAQMPYLDPQMFGPFRASAYVQSYLLFLLPNLVFTAAILFTIAALSRQMLPAFLGGIGMFLGYLLAGDLRDGLANRTVAALTDPFGLAALEELTRYWTRVELDTRLIGFPEILLWNRLVSIVAGMAVLGLLHLRFRFTHPGGRPKRWEKRAEVVRTGLGLGPVVPVAIPSVPRAFGLRARAWQTLAVARRSWEEIAGNRAFLVILGGALFIVFAFGWNVGEEVFGTSTWPVTHLVAGTVLGTALSPVIAVLIALFAGELVWRERDVGMSAIGDTAPVPEGVFLLGRFLALAGMLVALQAVLMSAGVLLQTLQGYNRFEPGLYVRILFGLKLVDYLLLAALAMAVHVVANQKYLGHLIVVLFFFFTVFSGRLGIRHHLLIYGSDPGWVYSDMNGFGPFVAPWLWFKLYWAGWALLLALLANLFWVRGRAWGARQRIGKARARFTGVVAWTAGMAVLLILTLGGFVFYNTNVLNDYRTPWDSDALRAEYERRYARYADAPQPSIVSARLQVEIYPGEHAADLRGTYNLVNRTAQAIDSVHLIIHQDIQARSIRFDRGARRVLLDPQLKYQIYTLERALNPGDSLRSAFDLAFQPRGFPNSAIRTAVVRNGAYFDRRWLPIIGYQPGGELTDDRARREHTLPPRPPMPSAHDLQALRHRSEVRDADLVHVDAIVGTDGDQIAVTPGTLHRTWSENGRRYFHYRTETPLPFGAPFLSARYRVREDRWRDVALQILHHPGHNFNLDRMVRSMKASLDYYSEHFGPYPFRQLRIVEFPRYASFARAPPHDRVLGRSAFLTRVKEGDIDRPFFVVAHETAHQWWGGQVVGAEVQGAAFVTETLAQYSAMMVMEKSLGREQVRQFYDYEMDHYLRGRSVFANREVPLLQVEDQRYLYYHKGAVAMYTLREHIGEERVNTALRRFLEKHRAGVPPYPTSLDVYREIRAVTPDSLHPLLRDLFEEITLWDVRTERAHVEPTGTGDYRVTLAVTARKVRADSIGNETEVPMDDLVEIGVFAGAGNEQGLSEALYLQPHRIRSGRQTITVTVPRAPTLAGIDPYRKLIQREVDDNLVSVQAATVAWPVGTGR